MRHGPDRKGPAASLAQGLGWFSIALGLTEAFAPGALARALGMPNSGKLLAGYGAREIAVGIGVLAAADPAPWIWGRAGGDALDLATLAWGLRRGNPRRGSAGAAFALVLAVTALDVACARALGTERARPAVPARDYRDRSGLPRSPEAMRGAARDFQAPKDMRTPEALRPHVAG